MLAEPDIRAIREAAKISQSQLAKLIGVNREDRSMNDRNINSLAIAWRKSSVRSLVPVKAGHMAIAHVAQCSSQAIRMWFSCAATLVSALVIGIGAVLVLQPGDALAAGTVRIAFIEPLSGPFALQGQERLKIFQAAAEEINSAGGVVGGAQLEIMPFDSKGSTQEAIALLQKAMDHEVRYVAASVSSVVMAISDALVKHNARNPSQSILLLDFNALDPALTESKCNFWHFRFEAHTDTQVKVLTEFMARQPLIRKVYLINQDYSYGQAVSRTANAILSTKRDGIQVVGDDLVPLGKVKDFSPYVAKIRASGADSVLTGNWGSDLSLLIKAGHEMGLGANFYTLVASLPGTPSTIRAAGAERVLAVSSWHINVADASWEKKLLTFRAKYQTVSNLDYLPAFRVMAMLANAINKAGTADPLKVAYVLEGMKYAGPSGESWMRTEDHQMIVPIYIARFVKAGQSGVKHDAEGTGYGWKTEALFEAKDVIPPLKCQMERPSS